MSLPRSVAEIRREHVTLEVEGIDRMDLNLYVPPLQTEGGVVRFFRRHRQQSFASSALMEPITKAFLRATEAFAAQHGVPLVLFEKGQRKDDVMAARLAEFTKPEGVVFIGKAQEKAAVFRTEKRRHATTGQAYPWLGYHEKIAQGMVPSGTAGEGGIMTRVSLSEARRRLPGAG